MGIYESDDLESQAAAAAAHAAAKSSERAREGAMAAAHDGPAPVVALVSIADLESTMLLLEPGSRLLGSASALGAWGSTVFRNSPLTATADASNPPTVVGGRVVFVDAPPTRMFIPSFSEMDIVFGGRDFHLFMAVRLNGTADAAWIHHADEYFTLSELSGVLSFDFVTSTGSLHLVVPGVTGGAMIGQWSLVEIERSGDALRVLVGGMGQVSGSLGGTMLGFDQRMRIGWSGVSDGASFDLSHIVVCDEALTREEARAVRAAIVTSLGTSVLMAEW